MTKQASDRWVECPAGSLVRQAAEHESALRKKQSLQSMTSALALCALVVVGYFGFSALYPSTDPVRLTCMDVMNSMEAYFDGGMQESDLSAIDTHLANCEPCHRKYKMRSNELGQTLRIAMRFIPLPMPLHLFAAL